MIEEIVWEAFTSEKSEKVMNPLEEKARDYLAKHGISELFGQITSLLLLHKPEDPHGFILKELRRYQSCGHCSGM